MAISPSDTAKLLQPWLARLTSRSPLDEVEQAAILGLTGHVQDVLPNRDFVRLGERTTYACIIVSGLAGRFEQTASGTRQITALHIPGDPADLHSVPVPAASSALQALTRTTIVRIPHAELSILVDRSPNIAMAFWRETVVDAAILSKWTLNIGRAPARQRIAHLLCEMSCRYAAIGADRFDLSFPATQVQLADAAGITNVHANRMLRELADDELVHLKNGKLQIVDWDKLVADASFDPTYLHLP